jgi:hypothetical protein
MLVPQISLWMHLLEDRGTSRDDVPHGVFAMLVQSARGASGAAQDVQIRQSAELLHPRSTPQEPTVQSEIYKIVLSSFITSLCLVFRFTLLLYPGLVKEI